MRIKPYLDSFRCYFHKRRMNLIADCVVELSSNDSSLERIIKEQAENLIKETHHSDHAQFLAKNKEILDQVKARVKDRYLGIAPDLIKRIRNIKYDSFYQ
jgi:hypothetical protein